MILRRRLHAELRCCGESIKSGNFSPVLDRHLANTLIVGFLQMRARMQNRFIAQMLFGPLSFPARDSTRRQDR